jgi:hypothetical protein
MTQTMNKLQGLAAQAGDIPATVQSRFSDDVRPELPGYVAAANQGTVVLRPGGGQSEPLRPEPLRSDELGADGATQPVYLLRPLPAGPGAAVARVARGADGDAAVQVAAQLSVGSGLDLVLTPSGRAATSVAEGLSRRGLRVRAGSEPAGGIVVAPVAGTDAESPQAAAAAADGRVSDVHLAVVAGTSEASDDMDYWVDALDLRTDQVSSQHERQQQRSQQESRQP